jgi:hypothetical protein
VIKDIKQSNNQQVSGSKILTYQASAIADAISQILVAQFLQIMQ